jgi:hypothetical protein
MNPSLTVLPRDFDHPDLDRVVDGHRLARLADQIEHAGLPRLAVARQRAARQRP